MVGHMNAEGQHEGLSRTARGVILSARLLGGFRPLENRLAPGETKLSVSTGPTHPLPVPTQGIVAKIKIDSTSI
jgi:hypothetical protein